MTELGFFHPVIFENATGWPLALQTVDSYFDVGIFQRVQVISKDIYQKELTVKFIPGSPPFLITLLKVATYITVILPLIMLLFKYNLRSSYKFIPQLDRKIQNALNAVIEKARETDKLSSPRVLALVRGMPRTRSQRQLEITSEALSKK